MSRRLKILLFTSLLPLWLSAQSGIVVYAHDFLHPADVYLYPEPAPFGAGAESHLLFQMKPEKAAEAKVPLSYEFNWIQSGKVRFPVFHASADAWDRISISGDPHDPDITFSGPASTENEFLLYYWQTYHDSTSLAKTAAAASALDKHDFKMFLDSIHLQKIKIINLYKGAGLKEGFLKQMEGLVELEAAQAWLIFAASNPGTVLPENLYLNERPLNWNAELPEAMDHLYRLSVYKSIFKPDSSAISANLFAHQLLQKHSGTARLALAGRILKDIRSIASAELLDELLSFLVANLSEAAIPVNLRTEIEQSTAGLPGKMIRNLLIVSGEDSLWIQKEREHPAVFIFTDTLESVKMNLRDSLDQVLGPVAWYLVLPQEPKDAKWKGHKLWWMGEGADAFREWYGIGKKTYYFVVDNKGQMITAGMEPAAVMAEIRRQKAGD